MPSAWCASWSSAGRLRCSTRSIRFAWRVRRRPRSRCVEQLGGAPDWLALPVGNGGNITAYWKGFGEIDAAPRMLAGQAAGAAPLITRAPVANPATIATAIRIGNPARLDEALAAVDDSNGGIRAIDDEGILAAYRMLAQEEGVFCEPASAASVAALVAAVGDGLSNQDRESCACSPDMA